MKNTLYLVGKVEIQNADGTGRLLLYAAFRKLNEAQDYINNYRNKYYKQRPGLCPLTIREVTR